MNRTDKENGMLRLSGTFVQDVPAPGRTWHIVVAGWTLGEGAKPRGEQWTTSTMPEFKVCQVCIDEAVRGLGCDDDCSAYASHDEPHGVG